MVCVFVNDDFSVEVLCFFYVVGICVIFFCCVGYNNVDFLVVEEFGFFVVNV